MTLRGCNLLVMGLLLCPAIAGAQMMPPGMDVRPRAPSDDDTLILTLPDRDNPARRVECGSGSYEQIISDCTEVLAVPGLDRGKRIAAFVNRATARYWLRQYPGAAVDYDQAIALQPSHLQAVLGRAVTWREMAQYDRAIADFDSALRLKPDWPELYLQRAAAYAANGDDARALADLDRVLRLAPNNATARLNRNIVLYRQQLALSRTPAQ
jgi:tetratricopeptide (TPR) repeat protein